MRDTIHRKLIRTFFVHHHPGNRLLTLSSLLPLGSVGARPCFHRVLCGHDSHEEGTGRSTAQRSTDVTLELLSNSPGKRGGPRSVDPVALLQLRLHPTALLLPYQPLEGTGVPVTSAVHIRTA